MESFETPGIFEDILIPPNEISKRQRCLKSVGAKARFSVIKIEYPSSLSLL